MTKEKILFFVFGLVFFILIVLILSYRYVIVQRVKEDIRNQTLNYLEQNLKFCKILKEKINTSTLKGEFWMICNNRPFYASYIKGKIETELNGWAFLKENENLWQELKDCNFYTFKDSQLIFYCPYTLENPIAKIYKFNNFKIDKIEETDFFNVLDKDIKTIYKGLEECNLKDKKLEGSNIQSTINLEFSCQDGEYRLLGDLSFFSLPVLVSNNEEKRRELSFEKVFMVKPKIENSKAILEIEECEISVRYTPDIAFPEIKCPDPESVIKIFGKYLLFPPQYFNEIKFIKKVPQEALMRNIFLVDGKLINVYQFVDKFFLIKSQKEGFYE